MGKRSLDDARTFGRSIQPTHDLQPEAGSADGSSLFAILDANEIEADAQPKKITLSGVANVVGPLLTPTAIPAAGANTQVQFNDGGFFGADGGLTYNKTTDALNAGAFIPTGSTVPTNGVYLPSANNVALSTNGVQRINIEADGDINIDSGGVFYDATNNRLAIGTTGPTATFHTETSTTGEIARLINTNTTAGYGLYIKAGGTFGGRYSIKIDDGLGNEQFKINQDGVVTVNTTTSTARFNIKAASAQPPLLVETSTTEALRVDASGRLLVGTSSARSNFAGNTATPLVQIEGVTAATASSSVVRGAADATGPTFNLGKTRGASVGLNTAVVSGDQCGVITFQGADGTNLLRAAQIEAAVDTGTVSGTSMPGRLVFSTTADGASSPTERLRITSTGQVRLAGAGITFNGDTATANELDDYEEGTWTPTATPSTSGTITLSGITASYTKIGNTVSIRMFATVSAVSSPLGYIDISLPFTNSGSAAGSVLFYNGDTGAVMSNFIGRVSGNVFRITYGTGQVGTGSASYARANSEIDIAAVYRN